MRSISSLRQPAASVGDDARDQLRMSAAVLELLRTEIVGELEEAGPAAREAWRDLDRRIEAALRRARPLCGP